MKRRPGNRKGSGKESKSRLSFHSVSVAFPRYLTFNFQTFLFLMLPVVTPGTLSNVLIFHD